MGNILLYCKNNEDYKECCGICLNIMKRNQKYQKYTCLHYFHKECIDEWNQSCPICRNSTLKRIKKEIDISGIRDMPNIVPHEYHDVYLKTWKKKECKKKNHKIIFRRPYGVIGACETCGCVQAFNLSHPVGAYRN